MPQTVFGFQRVDTFTIPGVGDFKLALDDYQITIGQEGSKNISTKIGKFVDTLDAYRLEAEVTLYFVERSVYEAIKSFVRTDILSNYLPRYQGSVSAHLGGEFFDQAIIKKVDPSGGSVLVAGATPGDPDKEYLDFIKVKLLDSKYRLV